MEVNITGGVTIQPEELPALVLAYIGDAVYELTVRGYLVSTGLIKVHQLHDETVKYVNAAAQAKILRSLEGRLTGVEEAIVRRGRNAKSPHVPRGAGVVEYRHSTALEALIGYLHLKGDTARLEEIMAMAFKIMGEEE